MIEWLNNLLEGPLQGLSWWPNMVSAGLLLACVLYWLTVAIGVLGPETFDFDLDLDADADVNLDGSGMGSLFGLTLALNWLNLGRVPLMIWLTPFAACALAGGLVIAPQVEVASWWQQGLMAGGVALVALVLTKGLTQPLIPLFAETALTAEESNRQLIGLVGTVVSGTTNESSGQIEVTTDGSPLKLLAKTATGARPLNRGDRVEIIERQPNGVAIVRAASEKP